MTKLPQGETPTHPRDISAGDLEVAMAAQNNPDLLGQLVELSRGAFGFYPSYFPYTITYPWASERLERVPAGSRALDIGAGVTPVPLYLARKGVTVECVDNSKHIRTLPVTQPEQLVLLESAESFGRCGSRTTNSTRDHPRCRRRTEAARVPNRRMGANADSI